MNRERAQSADPKPRSCVCSDWSEFSHWLEEFEYPEISQYESELHTVDWVFRGLSDSRFQLKPTIEREAQFKSISWPALEKLVTIEFKARAPMHLSPALIPAPEDELRWLAQMQHYGVPTRLLDFTYSPFVALYFAIREQQRNDTGRSHVQVCAIDATAVSSQFEKVARAADEKARERDGEKIHRNPAIAGLEFGSDVDSMISATHDRQALITKSLFATEPRRSLFNRHGCVTVASPPIGSNPRLVSQNGVFLVNCAEGLTFEESLKKMMEPVKIAWRRQCDISTSALPEIEQRLFQMNIHEQSLFPDMQGLAGFVRQKIRLHWK